MEKRTFVSELRENQSLVGTFLVRSKSLANTRSGKPYLSLRLADRSGEITGRVWERAKEVAASFGSNEVVRIQARVERYREQLQLNISSIQRLEPAEVDPAIFLPSGPEDPQKLWRQLKQLGAQVQNLHLRRLLHTFLTDREFARRMKQAPAAKSMHHAYLGGLLEHTVSVTRLLERICDHYPALDRDLLITAGILHDIGKLEEFHYRLYLDYTDAGRLLGHVVLGAQQVEARIRQIKGFPHGLSLALQHLIVSHHGEHEFGAPRRPKTPEAFALHYVDDLDAKMNHLSRLLAAEAETPGSWTSFQPLYERYIYKGGTEEVPAPEAETPERAAPAAPENYSLLEALAASRKDEES